MERRFLTGVFMNVWAELNNAMMMISQLAEESDDEDENIVALHMLTQVNEEPHRIQEYLENTVLNYTDKEFQSHFRLHLETFEELERILGPQLSKEIPIRKKLLSVLWLLATPDSFRSVGDRFDLAKSSLHSCFTAVVQELNKIAAGIIKWPNDTEQIEAEETFAGFAGLRGCIGAVDGTFVEIKAPSDHQHVYICRKSYHAVQLQAIATPNLRFTDVFAGYPGSVGDRRVFVNSPIYRNIEENKSQYFGEDKFILGDKAYPVLPWCIPPFIDRGNLSPIQTNFNTKHSKTRQVVERTFALLFGRYRRLKYLDMSLTKFIPETILACCVLHNLCLLRDNSDSITEMILEGEAFLSLRRARMDPENIEDAGSRDHVNDGHRVRNRLMRRFQ